MGEEVLETQQYRNAHEALRMIHNYRKEYIRSNPIIPEHDRDENCRTENIVITY